MFLKLVLWDEIMPPCLTFALAAALVSILQGHFLCPLHLVCFHELFLGWSYAVHSLSLNKHQQWSLFRFSLFEGGGALRRASK